MLTKEEAMQKHKELWNKIHDMTLREKTIIYKHTALEELGYSSFTDELGHPSFPTCKCWACEYDTQKKREKDNQYHFVGDCSNCLLAIPFTEGDSSMVPCLRKGSPYTIWGNTHHYITAAYWAKVIAELPVNPDT